MFLIPVGIIAIIIYCFVYFNRKKYIDFVEKNSLALKKLLEINGRYTFYSYVNFDQNHTYDNEIFYDTISCLDYLTYQLQYYGKQIVDQIQNVNANKGLYQKYFDEIQLLEFGQFEVPIEKLKLNKLLKLEKARIQRRIHKRPTTEFSLTVTLYLSTINGRIYNKKQQRFSANEVFSLMKRLRNKRGSFYNDREIWDSLCRVERGKVSNKMRFSIYQRDGNKCRYCGASGKYVKLEVDHIIPIAKGGQSTYNNLQTLCHRCNYQKSDNIYH